MHRIKQCFHAEDRSEQEAEDHRRQSRPADDAGEPVMLDFFQQQTADQKQRALTEIAEHDAEQQAERDGHKRRRIQVVIIRQTVHLDEHLERTEQPGVVQHRRRHQLRRRFRFDQIDADIQSVKQPDKLIRCFFRHKASQLIIVLHLHDIAVQLTDFAGIRTIGINLRQLFLILFQDFLSVDARNWNFLNEQAFHTFSDFFNEGVGRRIQDPDVLAAFMQLLNDEVLLFDQTQLFEAFRRQTAHSERNILALMHRLKSIAPHFFQSDFIVVRQGHQLVRICDHRKLLVDFLDKRFNFRFFIAAADRSGFQLETDAMANIFQLVQVFVVDVFVLQRLAAVLIVDQMDTQRFSTS